MASRSVFFVVACALALGAGCGNSGGDSEPDGSVVADGGRDSGTDAGRDSGTDAGPDAAVDEDAAVDDDAAVDPPPTFTCTPQSITCAGSGVAVAHESCIRTAGPSPRCELRVGETAYVCASTDCSDCALARERILDDECPVPVCRGTATACDQRAIPACADGFGCTVGGTCGGVAASCSSRSPSNCGTQSGCFLAGGSVPTCMGTATPCAQRGSEATCANQVGCSWQAFCSGNATCQLPNDECAQQPGCAIVYE